MAKNTLLTGLVQTLVDENDVEILVNFDLWIEADEYEECHGVQVIGGGTTIEINRVEIVIAGVGIDITKQLSRKQRNKIADNIEVEDYINLDDDNY